MNPFLFHHNIWGSRGLLSRARPLALVAKFARRPSQQCGPKTGIVLLEEEAQKVEIQPRSCSAVRPSGSPASPVASRSGNGRLTGQLILNADDWGLDRKRTDRILHCIARGSISSISAMVFMEDSERAAEITRELEIDAGLHINVTAQFSSRNCSALLQEHQRRIYKYLLRSRYAQVVFNPALIQSFRYVISAQLEEFERIYGIAPKRFDGHHHMHLCSNVLVSGLLPEGSVVRRSFSFLSDEKSLPNRLYRKMVDRLLARNYRLVDFFGSVSPIDPQHRLQRIFSLARHSVVELSAHPADPEEYRLLASDEIFHRIAGIPIAKRFTLLPQQ